MVVLGILIALQVDQWAQQRQEQKLQQIALARLKEDLQGEFAGAAAAEAWARDRLAAVELLDRLAANPEAAAADPASVPWAMETASWRSFPKAAPFIYNELKSSGQMRLVGSLELRRQLADHYAILARDAWVGEDRSAEESFDQAMAGLLNRAELTALEQAAGERRSVAIDARRATALARDFADRREALDQLPSVAQHHLFNLRVIGDMKVRIRRLEAAVDRELSRGE